MAFIIEDIISYDELIGNSIRPVSYDEAGLIMLGLNKTLFARMLKCDGIDLDAILVGITEEQKAALSAYIALMSILFLEKLDTNESLISISDGYTYEKFKYSSDQNPYAGLEAMAKNALFNLMDSLGMEYDLMPDPNLGVGIVASDSQLDAGNNCACVENAICWR